MHLKINSFPHKTTAHESTASEWATVPSGRVNIRAISVKSGHELLELDSRMRQGVMIERDAVIYRPAGVTRAG